MHICCILFSLINDHSEISEIKMLAKISYFTVHLKRLQWNSWVQVFFLPFSIPRIPYWAYSTHESMADHNTPSTNCDFLVEVFITSISPSLAAIDPFTTYGTSRQFSFWWVVASIILHQTTIDFYSILVAHSEPQDQLLDWILWSH